MVIRILRLLDGVKPSMERNNMVEIVSTLQHKHVVRYLLGDEQGNVGFIWCGIQDGNAIVDGNVDKITTRCVKAVKYAFNSIVFPKLKELGYDKVYCTTPNKKLLSMLAASTPEYITDNIETGIPIYKVEI